MSAVEKWKRRLDAMAKMVLRLKTVTGLEIEDRADVATVADVSKLLKKATVHLVAIRKVMPQVMDAKLQTVSLRLEQGDEKTHAAAAAS